MSKITAKPPKRCDLCKEELLGDDESVDYTCYDGKTIYGPWAWMCLDCFINKGTGLGTGRGQRYVYDWQDEKWYKEED